MKKILTIGIAVALFAWGLRFQVQAVSAASLKFDQAAYAASNGSTFTVNVIVDGGTDSVSGADAFILYDSSKLQPVSATQGTFFPNVTNNLQYATGKAYVSGSANDFATSKSGSGTMATVTFKVIADGSSILSFDCQTSTVVKADASAPNIMTCSQNSTATVSSGLSSGSPSSSSSSSSSGTTPSSLPKTGFFDDVRRWSIIGTVLMLIGISLRLLL